jgi:hypothetical protein
MPVLRRLRKPAIWTGVVILLLPVIYAGTYFRIVNRVYVAESFQDASGMTVQRIAIPHYMPPWPAPSLFNTSGSQQSLVTFYAPMYRLDRRLRPDVWSNPGPVRVPREVTNSP